MCSGFSVKADVPIEDFIKTFALNIGKIKGGVVSGKCNSYINGYSNAVFQYQFSVTTPKGGKSDFLITYGKPLSSPEWLEIRPSTSRMGNNNYYILWQCNGTSPIAHTHKAWDEVGRNLTDKQVKQISNIRNLLFVGGFINYKDNNKIVKLWSV